MSILTRDHRSATKRNREEIWPTRSGGKSGKPLVVPSIGMSPGARDPKREIMGPTLHTLIIRLQAISEDGQRPAPQVPAAFFLIRSLIGYDNTDHLVPLFC